MQKLFVGVDGGGSKTRALAFQADTLERSYGESTGCNPNNVGYESAARVILEAIARSGVPLSEQVSLCLGIAGLASDEIKENLRAELIGQEPRLTQAQLYLTHDLEIAHHAAFSGTPGILLVAGTGSACYGRDARGREYRASGRAAPHDDPGSGYAIAKRAMDRGVIPIGETQEQDRSVIAGQAKRVVDLAAAGNAEALEVLQEEAKGLAELALPVISSFPNKATLTIALHGGLVESNTVYRSLARSALKEKRPEIRIIHPLDPSTTGALQIAYERATGKVLDAAPFRKAR